MNGAGYIELPGASLTYFPGWLSSEKAESLFHTFLCALPWEQPLISIAGRRVLIPRKQVWMGDPGSVMRYSGVSFSPATWTDEVLALKKSLFEAIGQDFNSVLLNLYRDGSDSVSWHADDEPELGSRPTIASLSLGATRRFSLKRKDASLKPLHLELNSGDLLIMDKDTQNYWMHCLPKDKSLVGAKGCERINLTFRNIKASVTD